MTFDPDVPSMCIVLHQARHINADVSSQGVFLLDNGTSGVFDRRLPWAKYDSDRPLNTIALVPYNSRVGRAQPVISHERQHDSDGPAPPCTQQEERTQQAFDQFHPLKHITVHDDLDYKLLSTDPFFIFARVATMAATSWTMFLNAIEEDITICEGFKADDLDLGMQEVRFITSLIDRVETFIAEVYPVIEAGTCRSWLSDDGSIASAVHARGIPDDAIRPELALRKATIQKALRYDADDLRARCAYLHRRCTTTTNILLSSAQLRQAQKGTEQAEQVAALTRLAFLFVPLAFIASLFGMNVKELAGNPPIYVFFVVAAPTLVMGMLLAHYKEVIRWVVGICRHIARARARKRSKV